MSLGRMRQDEAGGKKEAGARGIRNVDLNIMT
jgi:hypothetical protein